MQIGKDAHVIPLQTTIFGTVILMWLYDCAKQVKKKKSNIEFPWVSQWGKEGALFIAHSHPHHTLNGELGHNRVPLFSLSLSTKQLHVYIPGCCISSFNWSDDASHISISQLKRYLSRTCHEVDATSTVCDTAHFIFGEDMVENVSCKFLRTS